MNTNNICGTTGPVGVTGFTGTPLTHSVTGVPYIVWVPKCDIDQLDDKLSPFPTTQLIKETLHHIDF